MNASPRYRFGIGFDAHELRRGRRLMLGGVHVPSPAGLAGHSDADALLHAITDALLGAVALPDIGSLFPDTDPRYAGADSSELLRAAYRLVARRRYRVVNVDCVLVCDRPRIGPHAAAIRRRIAGLLDVGAGRVGLKSKTTEGTRLAVAGRSMAAIATVLLERRPR